MHLPRSASRQRGLSLLFALIGLVTMTLAGLALIRATITSNNIAGNFAFKSAALQASDVGVEAAFSQLNTIIASTLDADYPSGCATGGCTYYATIQNSLDSAGIPTAINWANVPFSTVNNDYKVYYVIDRLCNGPLPVADLVGKCYAGVKRGGNSNKAGGVRFTSANELYFRVTVRVEGPRNTISYVQTLLSH